MVVILVSSSIGVADVLHVLMVCLLVGRDFAFCTVGKTWAYFQRLQFVQDGQLIIRRHLLVRMLTLVVVFQESLFVPKMAIIHRKM